MSGARTRLLLIASALLAGCTLLPESPPQDIYRLPASSIDASAAREAPDATLRVARPTAAGVLRSARIAVVPDDNLLSVYQGARWNAPVPELWRDHLLDAFHNDGRVQRLSSDADSLQADRELGGTLRAFQTEYADGQPRVVIRLDAHLADPRSRRIVDSRRFAHSEVVEGDRVAAVVEAFGRASDALARELIDWTVETLAQPPG